MTRLFKEFFVCPFCNAPILSKEAIPDAVAEGSKYCTRCGRKISNSLKEASEAIEKSAESNARLTMASR